MASTATSARACAAARECSKTTSRELPLIHSQKSCWVAGARWPPTALIGVNGRSSSGACSGATARQRSLPPQVRERQTYVDATGVNVFAEASLP